MTWIMSQRIILHPREVETEGISVIVGLPTVSPLSPGVETIRSDGSVTVVSQGQPDDHGCQADKW